MHKNLTKFSIFTRLFGEKYFREILKFFSFFLGGGGAPSLPYLSVRVNVRVAEIHLSRWFTFESAHVIIFTKLWMTKVSKLRFA